MTHEEMEVRMLELMERNEQLQKQLEQANAPRKAGELTIRTGAKGTVNVLGLSSRFGVSLYPEVWYALFGIKDRIIEHIKADRDKLSFKRGIPELGITSNQDTFKPARAD
jgi:hypothetical protein